jgi:hypothetical protein
MTIIRTSRDMSEYVGQYLPPIARAGWHPGSLPATGNNNQFEHPVWTDAERCGRPLKIIPDRFAR